MAEVSNPFDCKKDYFSMLKDSELYDGEYPLLKGLQRLAHNNRGGIVEICTHIMKSELDIAAVTVDYVFRDGTRWSGSADATKEAHKKPYNLHLVAVAESKAESRCLRRAFNISKVTFEEIGAADVAGEPDSGPIEPHQIEAIKKVAKRKKISKIKVLELIDRSDLDDITELTAKEGREAMKAVNKVKVSNE